MGDKMASTEDNAVKGLSRAVQDLREAGNAHVSKGAWSRAIKNYTKAIELDQSSAILYCNRACAHYMNQEFEPALEDATKALEIDPKWWKGYKWKGLALLKLNRWEESIEVYEMGIKEMPDQKELEEGLENAKAAFEEAQNLLYVLPGPKMMAKLDGIPVFIVTDDKGQPFFITYEDGQQICTFYFQHSDAVATLEWIKQENPNLGQTAVVVVITLSQAFHLAQDTQQQYQKEEQQKAAEKASAAEALEASPEDTAATDAVADTEKAEAPSETPAETPADSAEAPAAAGEEANGTGTDLAAAEATDKKDPDDLDADVPLAFQFRPELRQVEAAVLLLNTPELRIVKKPEPQDPATAEASSGEAKPEDAAAAASADKPEEGEAKKPEEAPAAEEKKEEPVVEEKKEEPVAEEKKEEPVAEEKKEEPAAEEKAEEPTAEKAEGADEGEKKDGDNGEEEYTVENYNGIPIFQARGLTLSQHGMHYIPLFFSKWDLEDAWLQLNKTVTSGVPDETEIDVGTLEDVLRRMVEGDGKEFENVIFVPTSESLKNVGRDFPLDELTNSAFGRFPMKKDNFEEARKIAASGGSKEAVREAIQKKLMQSVDKTVYADQLDRIQQATKPKPSVGKPVASKMAVKPKKKRAPLSTRIEQQRMTATTSNAAATTTPAATATES